MKFFLTRGGISWVSLAIMMSIGSVVERAWAQDNSWTSPVSGNWQDASWSLGVIPGTNQNVFLTNSGWKALQLSAATAHNFPQSFTVNSLVVASPADSFNTLLLNFTDGTPFNVKTISVASNSAITMLSSTLQINGPNGEGMTIGGEFDQNNSTVSGNQINVGYIGPGIYNLNSGTLTVSQLWVGGPFVGTLNQNGGTNAFGITHLAGGKYVLSNGYYAAAIYFDGGQFRQEGGLLDSNLTMFEGSYELNGGVHQGDISVPVTDGFSSGNGSVVQAGGTNYGSLDIGSQGFGNYTMSNGVSLGEEVFVDYQGSYNQWTGTQTVNFVTINEALVAQNAFQGGSFNLAGGQVSSTGMFVGGFYTQTGGTNRVAGDVLEQNAETALTISGGLFTANNLTAQPGFVGGVFLTGGTMVISNLLSLAGASGFPLWQGFVGGGQLIVSNLWLGPQSIFNCAGGTVLQSGLLTLASANLFAGSNTTRFGQMFLSSVGLTNSTLAMPTGASVVNFADSSGIAWSNTVNLVVDGWSGSLLGGGQQQIVFGNSANALTPGQIAQIQFQNPAGLAAGTYSAKILATGEIVPNLGVVSPSRLALSGHPGGIQLTLQGEPGRTYSIEVSTDLVHWAAWINEVDVSGTISFVDTDSINYPARFYRARLLP